MALLDKVTNGKGVLVDVTGSETLVSLKALAHVDACSETYHVEEREVT